MYRKLRFCLLKRRKAHGVHRLMLWLQVPVVNAENTNGIHISESASQQGNIPYETYILGPNDQLNIELLDLPELSGKFTVSPDGVIFLPRLKALKVEGLTIEDLRVVLKEKFLRYVRQPEVFITPTKYRSVRVYVGGEVALFGYYKISSGDTFMDLSNESQQQRNNASNDQLATLFDALQAARGITPFSKLDTVNVTRKRPLSKGGGKVRAKVNFLRLIRHGDEEVNIRLFDGDVIYVQKSEEVMREQLLAASRTNLSPDFIQVFVSGRTKEPGAQRLPQGATLNQAIASAGGPKWLNGKSNFFVSIKVVQ